MQRRTVWTLLAAGLLNAADWTKPVEVMHEVTRCISYRAKLEGDTLLIEVKPEKGWHTFAMDNKVRVEEKLAGKKALGVDKPTEVKITGLEVVGGWMQTPPKDFSKPELRLYAWGFEETALLAAKVKRTAGPIQVGIRGQSCTEVNCRNIDIAIAVPAGGKPGAPVDLASLVPVRQAKAEAR